MKRLEWFERKFTFGLPAGMLPFYLERLQGTISRIESKVKGVSDEILSQKLDNKWSVKQNIGHLAEGFGAVSYEIKAPPQSERALFRSEEKVSEGWMWRRLPPSNRGRRGVETSRVDLSEMIYESVSHPS
jgi:hypothetical protein